jgi:hypothetical protein
MLTPVVLALGMLLSTLAAAPITQSDRDKLIQDLEPHDLGQQSFGTTAQLLEVKASAGYPKN